MDKIKLPRHIIAKMVNDNPQAIKALENMQLVALNTPADLESVNQLAGHALDVALQALMMVVTAPKDEAYLQAVGVPMEQVDYLTPVAIEINVDNYLGVL